ncbi:MAG TPA: 16S rRNA pseudouridine(516) synthase [Clostridiaceae bacterium]|nr:16S rRNA pseudouridine(516) synthase [Clostridiaceae bacterium]
MAVERIDKVLSNMGFGSRKEIKEKIKKKTVTVDDTLVTDPGYKVDPEEAKIVIEGEEVYYRKYIYLLMNKPQGVVSATFDNHDQTVVDLLPFDYKAFDPAPVGRLDKDTVGLLLLTNDGELNHKLLSPKNHVDKVYYVYLKEEAKEEDIKAFEKGVVLGDGYKCMPAGLKISEEDKREVHVTLREGKFHQVKRMFLARENEVTYLQRVSFGPLILDEELEEGEFRELTEEELALLKNGNS